MIKVGWRMADGGWQMADGRWQMADGRWQMADGRWQMADGRWQMDYPFPAGSPQAAAAGKCASGEIGQLLPGGNQLL
ncbi:hypothetical protein NH00_04490 [Enterobacter cancerogenus]|nr:hypothetical protein NH00_04490 [Enterobacter cancerogenus]